MLTIEQIRRDAPACEQHLFFNSAGSSLMPTIVTKAMHEYLDLEAHYGGYEVMAQKEKELGTFYTEMARMLNAQPHQIAFGYSATYTFARALSSIPFDKGDVILTTDEDYISNQINFLSLKKRFGIKLVRSRNLENGDLDLAYLEQQIIDHKPKLLALTEVPTNSGLVHPAIEVGKLCRKYGIWYILDSCQSVGQMVVDVEKIQCDFLSGTGRKFLRGPRGTAFLYASDRVFEAGLEPLFIDARGSKWDEPDYYEAAPGAQRFETFEVSYEGMMGLAKALEYANAIGIQNIEDYNTTLRNHLVSGFASIKGLRHLDIGTRHSNIITVAKEGKNPGDSMAYLKSKGLLAAMALRMHAIIDFDKKGESWALRLSPHYFNTIEECDRVLELLEEW